MLYRISLFYMKPRERQTDKQTDRERKRQTDREGSIMVKLKASNRKLDLIHCSCYTCILCFTRIWRFLGRERFERKNSWQ